jgi:Family of unknown function (DUF6491)
MRVVPILMLSLFVAGCANTEPSQSTLKYRAFEAERLEKRLANYTAGTPKRCVRLRELSGPESYGDGTLIFSNGRNLLYRNDTRGACRKIGAGRALITKTWGSEVCSGDFAQVADLSAGYVTDNCALGEFVPYRRNK